MLYSCLIGEIVCVLSAVFALAFGCRCLAVGISGGYVMLCCAVLVLTIGRFQFGIPLKFERGCIDKCHTKISSVKLLIPQLSKLSSDSLPLSNGRNWQNTHRPELSPCWSGQVAGYQRTDQLQPIPQPQIRYRSGRPLQVNRSIYSDIYYCQFLTYDS